MYSTSAAYKAAMANRIQRWNLTGTLSVFRIDQGQEVEYTQTLLADNFLEGSLNLDVQGGSDGAIDLGGVYASVVSCTLTQLSGIGHSDFAKAFLSISTGIQIAGGSYEMIPLGTFRITEANWTLEGVEVTGYDRMTELDVPFIPSGAMTGKTPAQWVALITNKFNLTLSADFSKMYNGTRTLTPLNWKDSIKSWRDLLHYLCQAIGCQGFILNDTLYLKPYQTTPNKRTADATLDSDASLMDAFSMSDTRIRIAGVYMQNSDGSSDYYGRGYDQCLREIEVLDGVIMQYRLQQDSYRSEINALLLEKQALWDALQAGSIDIYHYTLRVQAIDDQIDMFEDKIQSIEENEIPAVQHVKSIYGAYADTAFDTWGHIELEYNPFLAAGSQGSNALDSSIQTTRWNIAELLFNIDYIPFNATVVGHAGWQLGDVITLTHGSITGTSLINGYTYDGDTVELRGFGGNDQLQSGQAPTAGSSIVAQDIADLKSQMSSVSNSVGDGKEQIAAAITGKGVYTAATDSFDVMANNIWMINNKQYDGYLIAKHTVGTDVTYSLSVEEEWHVT